MTLDSTLIQIFSSIPPWLAVIIIAALPVAELRMAIPIAILKPPYGFGLDPLTAIVLSVIGNITSHTAVAFPGTCIEFPAPVEDR